MADVSFPLPQRVSTINSINGTNKRDPSTWCQRPTNPLVDDFYPLIKARTRLKQYYLLKVTTFECLYHSLLNISLINIRENIGKIFDFFLNLDATKQDELYLRLNQARLSSWKPSNLLKKKKTRKRNTILTISPRLLNDSRESWNNTSSRNNFKSLKAARILILQLNQAHLFS